MSRDSNQAVYFQCQLCGECCSSWNIPIEAHKAEALLQKDWVQERLRETRRALSRQSPDMYRIPLTDENVCVFLAEDRRCLIEVREGLSLKPHECQRFPFATVRLPDGSAVHDTSAACKSVSEKLMMAFQPILPKPDEKQPDPALLPPAHQAWLEDIGRFPAKVPLSLFRKLDWQDYIARHAAWRAWFLDPSLSARQTLALVSQELGLQPAFHRLKMGASTPVLPLVLFFLRKPYRTLSWLSLLRGKRYHDPRVFGEPLDLERLNVVEWHPAHEQRLKAFAWSILSRKRLLSAGGSVQSVLAMAGVSVLLAQWYARALASLQESANPSEQDVSTAIRLVERYYSGHQPRFFNFFLSRWKSEIVSRFF